MLLAPLARTRRKAGVCVRDLTTGREGRLIFCFAMPMLIGNAFQQLYNMVDSVVVGRFVGKEALAAVGVSFLILFLLIALVLGMTMGSTIILAQYYGARDMEKVRRTIETLLHLPLLLIDRGHGGRPGSQRGHPARPGVLRIRLKGMRFDREIFRHSIRIGLPSAVQQVLMAMGLMALSRIVNAFGTDTIAGFTVATRLDTFAMMPAMNFSMALSAFVGQNMGAGKTDRVNRGYRITLLLSGAIAAVFSVLMVFLGEPFIRIFNSDPTVVGIGSRYLLIVGAAYILFSTLFITHGVLRGAGDTLIPMFITLIALWVVRIPTAAMLSQRMGPDGIWLATPIGWSVGLALSLSYYSTGRWKRKAVVQPVPTD